MTITKIRELNDNLRQNFTDGRILITRGVAELPIDKQLEVIKKIRNFSNFNKDNAPNGETITNRSLTIMSADEY